MRNYIVFKNGELETSKDLVELMKERTGRTAIFPVPKFSDAEFQLKSLVANFHFLKDQETYSRLLECAYFIGSIKALNSEKNNLDKKNIEDTITWREKDKLKQVNETLMIFENIQHWNYTKEQIAFCNSDNWLKFFVVYFTKDESAFSLFPHFKEFIASLENGDTTQILKQKLQKVLDNFQVKVEDDVYLPFKMRATTELVEDCKARYYKGRKIAKGKVKRTFDDKGKIVRLEIVLAIIEALQEKGRKAYEEQEAQAKKEEEEKEKALAKAEAERQAEAEAIAKAKAEAEAKRQEAEAQTDVPSPVGVVATGKQGRITLDTEAEAEEQAEQQAVAEAEAKPKKPRRTNKKK